MCQRQTAAEIKSGFTFGALQLDMIF